MAHSCPNCECYCTCSGDWDDLDLGMFFPLCTHCDEADEADEDQDEYINEDDPRTER